MHRAIVVESFWLMPELQITYVLISAHQMTYVLISAHQVIYILTSAHQMTYVSMPAIQMTNVQSISIGTPLKVSRSLRSLANYNLPFISKFHVPPMCFSNLWLFIKLSITHTILWEATSGYLCLPRPTLLKFLNYVLKKAC